MYAVFDDYGKLVAFHSDKKVIKKYCMNVYNQTRKEYRYRKIKMKQYRNYRDHDGLYLIRYEDTYVQKEYYEYIDLELSSLHYENQMCEDVLRKILEVEDDLTLKERRHIEKALKIVDRILHRELTDTIELQDLKYLQDQYDQYRGNLFDLR